MTANVQLTAIIRRDLLLEMVQRDKERGFCQFYDTKSRRMEQIAMNVQTKAFIRRGRNLNENDAILEGVIMGHILCF